MRASIRQFLSTSVQAMMKTCDSSLNCGNYWSQGQPQAPNVHYQMNSVELMTAYAKTFKAGAINTKVRPPSQAPKGDTGAAFKLSVSEVLVVLLTIALLN